MSDAHRDLINQLQAICDKHGCPAGMVRQCWIDDELTRRAAEIERLRALVEFYENGGKTMDEIEAELAVKS